MPIQPSILQRRHAEHGRIRLGKKQVTENGKTYPAKLQNFRFTSGSRAHIEALADLYGGSPSTWKNGSKTEWEVITDATTIPVYVVKGGMSQWLETWTGGGCVHRCDGVVNVLTDEPCDPDDPDHRAAKPTTRLSVMLSDLESLGVWRLESHGWNAAAELPSMADLAAALADLVPAVLSLQQRTTVSDGKTSQFIVPVLDLSVTKRRLAEVVAANFGGAQVGAREAVPQIEAPGVDWEQSAAEAATVDECKALWGQAGAAGALTDAVKAALTRRAEQLSGGDVSATEPAAATNTHASPHTSEEEDDDAINGAWQDMFTAAGQRGMTASDLTRQFTEWAGCAVEEASAEQFKAFTQLLTTGEMP